MDQRSLVRFWPLATAVSVVRHAWSHDIIRLWLLTVYYLAIIVGLIVLYGGTTYTPPPFVYQGF